MTIRRGARDVKKRYPNYALPSGFFRYILRRIPSKMCSLRAGPVPQAGEQMATPPKPKLPDLTKMKSSAAPSGTAAAAAPAPAKAPEPAHFLQRIKLFSGLSVIECAEVVKRMKRRDFPPNQVIVREGAPGNSMYFITAGHVEVRKKDATTGIDFLIAELGPGQNFGEMPLITGKPRIATVTSTQPTTCAVLEQKDFHELLLAYPKIGIALTTILAERLESAQQHVGVEFINLGKMNFDPRVLALLPHALMQQHKMIPVAFANNRLSLAMVNPNNIIALDDVRRIIKG